MYKNNLLVGFNYWYQKVYDFVSLWEPFTHINNSCKRCLLVYNPTNYSDYSKKKNPLSKVCCPLKPQILDHDPKSLIVLIVEILKSDSNLNIYAIGGWSNHNRITAALEHCW